MSIATALSAMIHPSRAAAAPADAPQGSYPAPLRGAWQSAATREAERRAYGFLLEVDDPVLEAFGLTREAVEARLRALDAPR